MSSEAVRILAAEVLEALASGRITMADLQRRLDENQLHACETLTLAKFDGDIKPGKEPVEVLEIRDGEVRIYRRAEER